MGRHSSGCVILALLMSSAAFAAPSPPQVIVDEWGNSGSTVPVYALPIDPTGLAPLTYILPFPVVPGDVLIVEPGQTEPSDLIRFYSVTGGLTTVMQFYSDRPEAGEFPVPPADIGLPPDIGVFPLVTITEIGDESFNYGSYVGFPGTPGFAPSSPIFVNYLFISDGAVPLPNSAAMGAAVMGALLVARKIRRWRSLTA